MVRLRVTEIEDFLTCRCLWDYKWNQGLRLPDDDEKAGPMITGRAVHHGLESALLLGGGQEAAQRYALKYLEQHTGYERFQRGVLNCIDGFDPRYYTLAAPQVERELSWPVPGIDYVLIGKPDLWYTDDDGAIIIDYKTTSKDEAEKGRGYQLWSQQTPLYGLLVTKYLESLGQPLPVYLQHIILSTQGDHFSTRPLLFTRAMADRQRAFVGAVAWEMAQVRRVGGLLYPSHSYFLCNRCDFATICMNRLTGLDYDDIIELHYEKRRA